MVEPESRGSLVAMGLALVGGAMIVVIFLDFVLWSLVWVAFVLIFVALERRMGVRRVIWLGFVAGMVTNVPAFFWLTCTIHVFGGFLFLLSLFFYFALLFYSLLQFVLFLFVLCCAGFGWVAIHSVLVWVALEFLFLNLFLWRFANSQCDVPFLVQIGDLMGPFGLSFVMVWASVAIAVLVWRGIWQARSAIFASMAAILCVIGYGAVRLLVIDDLVVAVPKVKLGLVQGNLTIEEKLDVCYFEGNLDTYWKVSEALDPISDVVIWLETVITEPLLWSLEELTPNGRAILGLWWPLFIGAFTYDANTRGERFFNSAILFDAEGRVRGFLDKQILMPFGEFMSLGSIFPVLKSFSLQTGDFQAGTGVNPFDVPGVARFVLLNCYEDFRAAIARRTVHDGRVQILFAVANDGWFGDTMVSVQYEALALWRAIENRRFLVRVTNTGVTDVIDAVGRVLLWLLVFQFASAVVDVARFDVASSYSCFGDWFGWFVTAVVLWALWSSAGS